MYNLLIVDDKDVFRRTIIRAPYFKANSDRFCIKYLAKNGMEALHYLQNGDIDVVLTDIRMPLMDGIELLKIIREKNLCKCTILLSEYADFSYAKEGIINGAFDYIVKPVNDEILQKVFDRAYHYLQSLCSNNYLFMDLVKRLSTCILSHDETLFLAALEDASHYLDLSFHSSPELYLLIKKFLQKLKEQIVLDFPYVPLYLSLEQVCSCKAVPNSVPESIRFFNTTLRRLRSVLKKFCLASSHPLIRSIWHYTLNSIECPLSLQSTAERFYVNKNYLSTLFRKETGIHYKDFILQLKIERAKVLLLQKDLKIYNISEQLYFSDTEYFSQVFKKQTGLLPSIYRQRAAEASLRAETADYTIL